MEISKTIKNKIFIVIAAYNESNSIANVIKDLQAHGYNKIIVVDDGSRDNTYEIISSMKHVYALRHLINRGQGAALKTAMNFAIKLGAEIVVNFDADGQHLAEDIDKIISPIVFKKYDASLGSRFLDCSSNVPFTKKIVLKGAVLLMYFFYGAKLTDAHNGFRALSRRALRKMHLVSDGMEHASEIISEIMKHRIRFTEVPVTIVYSEYTIRKGQSIFNSFKILFRMIFKKILEI